VLSLESPEKALSLRARVGGRLGVSIPSWLSRESVMEIGTKNPAVEIPPGRGDPSSDDNLAAGKLLFSTLMLLHSVSLATSAFSKSSCHGDLTNDNSKKLIRTIYTFKCLNFTRLLQEMNKRLTGTNMQKITKYFY